MEGVKVVEKFSKVRQIVSLVSANWGWRKYFNIRIDSVPYEERAEAQ